MKKLFYTMGLCFLALSCGSTNKVVTAPPKAVITEKVEPQNQPQPTVEIRSGEEFFTQNIADISNNDNTASYGSIVTANPVGYKVTKDYFPSLGQNFRQRYIILHYTALNVDRSITELTGKSVSAHYLVSDINDKEIYQLVDEDKRSYHAGISSWGKDNNLNDTSIGIEIVNEGYIKDDNPSDDDGRYFYDFKPYQIEKVAALVKDLAQRYNIKPNHILGHSDVAPTRKQDPGPKFPWKLLYEKYNLGMWYDQMVKNNLFNQYRMEDFYQKNEDHSFIFQFQSDLSNLGYGIEKTGEYDKNTEKVVQAFQYHFRPEKADGFMDAETYAILKALLQKYAG